MNRRTLLLFLRWLKTEYPSYYSKYKAIPRKYREVIARDATEITDVQDIRDILFEIKRRYEDLVKAA